MQESKRNVFVQKPGTPVFVPIEVAPGECVGDVLAGIGVPGALGLSTASGGPGLVFLAPATLWNWIDNLQTLYVVRSSCPW